MRYFQPCQKRSFELLVKYSNEERYCSVGLSETGCVCVQCVQRVRALIKEQPQEFGSVGEVPGSLLLPLTLEVERKGAGKR